MCTHACIGMFVPGLLPHAQCHIMFACITAALAATCPALPRVSSFCSHPSLFLPAGLDGEGLYRTVCDMEVYFDKA